MKIHTSLKAEFVVSMEADSDRCDEICNLLMKDHASMEAGLLWIMRATPVRKLDFCQYGGWAFMIVQKNTSLKAGFLTVN